MTVGGGDGGFTSKRDPTEKWHGEKQSFGVDWADRGVEGRSLLHEAMGRYLTAKGACK